MNTTPLGTPARYLESSIGQKLVMVHRADLEAWAAATPQPVELPTEEDWWWEWIDTGWKMRDVKKTVGGTFSSYAWTPLGSHLFPAQPGRWLRCPIPPAPSDGGEQVCATCGGPFGRCSCGDIPISSVESDYEFCQLCEARSRQRDAENREVELTKELASLRQRLATAEARLEEIRKGCEADAADLEKMRDGTKMTRSGLVSLLVFQGGPPWTTGGTMLDSVLLKGTHRGHPAQAYWTRVRDGETWRVTLTVGSKSTRYRVDRREKPCWAVSTRFMDEFLPGCGSVKKRQEKPVAEDDGMILKIR